jgi:serine/alanine adding enzyme
MTLRQVAPDDWDDFLTDLALRDVYLRRGYVESGALLAQGQPVFLERSGVVFAAIVRTIPGASKIDVATPYGYGGPVASGSGDATAFWNAYAQWCVEQGVVTSFFRFHPLYENHRYAGPFVRLEPLAGTVAWRLGADDLFGSMHGSHRNSCRKAHRAGVAIATDESPTRLDDFAALYEETMHRQQAAEFYFFAPQYWDALSGLGDDLVRFDARLEGTLVASILCLATRPWLHYHLSATSAEGRKLGATNLALFEAAAWAKERRFEFFHLGGGVGGSDDSLFGFKRRFDPPGVRECWIGKAVHDEDAYRALTGGTELDLDGFFPGYRVPGTLSQTAGVPDRAQRIRPTTVADVMRR